MYTRSPRSQNMDDTLIRLYLLGFIAMSCVHVVIAEEGTVLAAAITRARCEARCLGEATAGTQQVTLTLEACNNHTRCLQCVKPCRSPYQGASQCRTVCQGDGEQVCVDSCLFLKSISVAHQGTCPPEDEATGFDAYCGRVCHDDLSCKDSVKTKCCSNGCGFTCQAPVLPDGIPSQVVPPIVHEQSQDGSVLLQWKGGASSLPVVYVVVNHFNVGKHHQANALTKWKFVTMTSSTSVTIRDVRPGRWYEFAVAAVSVNGSHGFSLPSKAFQLSKAPNPPSPPQRLSQGDSKVNRKHINLLVHWQPPRQSDLQIIRYKVSWSKRLSYVTANLVPITVHSKAVRGNQLSFRIRNLEPNTKYYIQVIAISQYGHHRLKSQPASMYVTTVKALASSTGTVRKEAPMPRGIAVLPPPPLLYDIKVGKIFYQQDQLQAQVKFILPEGLQKHIDKFLIHWTPEVCMGDRDVPMTTMSATTHEWQFALFGLHYDCMYVVKVQPVSPEGRPGDMQHTMFYTPSCEGDPEQGQEQSSCPEDAPHPLSAPVGVNHSFLMSSTNVSVVIRWKKPTHSTEVKGYRLLWGVAVKQHRTPQPVMDRDTAITVQLHQDAQSYTLLDLQPGGTFVIQIQGLSSIGPGRPAFLMFTTPSQNILDSLRPVRTSLDLAVMDEGSRAYTSLQTESSRENSHPDHNKSAEQSLHATSSGVRWTSCKFSLSVLLLWTAYLTKVTLLSTQSI